MTAGAWTRIVVLLGAACLVSLTAMIAASDAAPGSRNAALAAAQVFTFALVTAAVVAAVRIARPFASPHRRPAVVAALGPAAAAAAGAVLTFAGVEPTLSGASMGLLTVFAVTACATARHGSASVIVAAGVGWWLICGGVIAWASVEAIANPDPPARVPPASLSASGDGMAVVLSLFAYVVVTGLTAALQLVVLALAAARRRVRTQASG